MPTTVRASAREAAPSALPEVGQLRGRRVAVVNWRDLDHSQAGGAELYAWAFAEALRDAGARVDYVTGRDRGQSRDEVRDGIAVHRGGGSFGFYAHAAAWLLRHRGEVDLVVDAETGIPSFAPLWLREVTPVVLVVHHVHQAQFAAHFPAPVARVGQWLERVAMPRVYRDRTALAVSESTRVELRDQLGWTGEVGLLPNGTDVPTEPAEERLDDVRLAAVKDPDRVVVLGRVVEHKRVELVVRSVAALAAGRPGLHLDVCGSGSGLDRVRAVVRELGVEDRVTLHGFVADSTKIDLLRRAALHVCASDAEGWGHVVIEAAAQGTPTLARDVPGLRDSVVDGRTGTLVAEPADHDLVEVGRRLTVAIDEALTSLDDAAERTRVAHATRAWADRYTWSAMQHDAVDLVADLLRPGPGVTHSFRTTAPTTER